MPADAGFAAPDAPLEERLTVLLDSISAYIEQYHGGAVRLVSFEGNVLRVRLEGACQGCPLSANTLHGWVEGTIRQYFPDIEVVGPEDPASSPPGETTA